jgi:hypothetical protein
VSGSNHCSLGSLWLAIRPELATRVWIGGRVRNEVSIPRIVLRRVLGMSAVGRSNTGSGFNDRAFLIGAHADFRTDDYYFLRTQSLQFARLQWEERIKPLRSWGDLALSATEISIIVLASLSLLFV